MADSTSTPGTGGQTQALLDQVAQQQQQGLATSIALNQMNQSFETAMEAIAQQRTAFEKVVDEAEKGRANISQSQS
ncbi:hypothetical protein FKG94_22570 [Exilibacterium tricleocarpae]|uniref:Uncharacterized protein n=1 Tax=Exilibacterium tricleocarpae TaxID=2591008 RepID=A0A545SYC4_9GAMM|nr:hypothetical protein [Exilibacterium tricleocarpae]TQV69939.1 hypothetical protein FKG94_22570 [Exilibacterium tricleocarpae]